MLTNIRNRGLRAAVGAGVLALAGCGSNTGDSGQAPAPSPQAQAPLPSPSSSPSPSPLQSPQAGLETGAVKSPRPVWSGLDFPYVEPPLAAAPAVTFGVSQLTRTAAQTVFSGAHTLPAGSVQNYRIGVFLHHEVFYWQGDAVATIAANGTFSVTLPRAAGTADRAVLILYPSTTNPLAAANCNAATGTCSGRITTVTKHSLPVDPSVLTAYTAAYFTAAAPAANAQIAGLQSMMNTPAIVGGPYGDGRLIRSFRDMDSAFLYDQALAVIAFSLAGERANAEAILNAMAKLQGASGAWVFSYLTDGEDANAGVDMRIAGSNAWFGMALNAYQKAFGSTRYLAMSTRLHDFLLGELVDITINGAAQRGLRFAPTNFAPGRAGIYALEHQLDAYASMHQYAALNGGSKYAVAAADLRRMSESLWNGSRFLGGFDANTHTLNTSERYLDNYSWSVLALGNTGSAGQNFAAALPGMCDYFTATGTLDYPSRKVTGVAGFYDVIYDNVPATAPFAWSEGSLGAIMAMRQGLPTMTCAGNTADDILESLNDMADKQNAMPYATRNGNADFTSSGSVAGTAWQYFAIQRKNPYAHY
jgi:ribosomal protein L21E